VGFRTLLSKNTIKNFSRCEGKGEKTEQEGKKGRFFGGTESFIVKRLKGRKVQILLSKHRIKMSST